MNHAVGGNFSYLLQKGYKRKSMKNSVIIFIKVLAKAS